MDGVGLVRLADPTFTDRHGHVRAHLVRNDGGWIQEALLRRGRARVALGLGSSTLVDEMLAHEAAARRDKVGIWSSAVTRERSASDLTQLDKDAGTYQLVTGVVTATDRRGNLIYLNFGADYRTDFTARIPRAAWPSFREKGLKPLELTDRTVRVRGWIGRSGRPAMELTHPAALEVLEQP